MKKILVEVSARHIHLSREHVDCLFGEGYQLNKIKDLSQPGQYAAAEKVLVKGSKSEMNLRVLGPIRSKTQIELSFTDARALGVTACLRLSGNIDGTCGVTLVGPKGEVQIKEGVIVAQRHIHMNPTDAAEFAVQDKDVVDVRVETNGRSLVFGDTVVRVNENFSLAMHIDTDEANAAMISKEVYGEIIKK